jgi:hypothetical protein
MFKGDYSYDEVLADPLGAVKWARDAWEEVNFVQTNQSNYDQYHLRDKRFEATMDEYHPKAVFPLPQVLVNQIATKSTVGYLAPGSFRGVPLDASLSRHLGFSVDQDEINAVAVGTGALIEKHMRDYANAATHLPLWAKNGSLSGAAMLAVTWKTETRMLPERNGGQTRKKIMLPDGSSRSILMPKMEERIVRESLDIQALAPGSWGVDPEAQDGSDAVWGYFEQYVTSAMVVAQAKDGYFNLADWRELAEQLGGQRGRQYTAQKIYFNRHVFNDESYKQTFGQISAGLIDRVVLKSFYTKEVRIYTCNDILLRVEANPYATFSDGFPFEIITFNGTGNIIGVSDLYALQPYFFEYNKLRNSELYNAELASDQAWITTESDPTIRSKFQLRQPGETIFSPQGANAFIPVPFNEMSPEVRNTRIGILEDLYLISGLNETSLGATPSANIRSQKQMSSLLQAQASRMEGSNYIVAQAMRSVANKFLCMYKEFMVQPATVKLQGKDAHKFAEIYPGMVSGVHEIEIETAFDREARRSQNQESLMNFIPLAAQLPEFDATALACEVLRDMGHNPEQFRRPGAPPQIQNGGGNAPMAKTDPGPSLMPAMGAGTLAPPLSPAVN